MVKMEPGKTKKRSLIWKYFNKDILFDLLKITMIADANNNEKGDLIKELLTKNNIPFNGLGPGTNRMAVQIDGYAVKFALDTAGMTDNLREYLYTEELYPYVIKVYECVPNGLVAVTEFVEIFNLDDFRSNKQEMADILKDISSRFLIGDVGITTKNYVNWGKRQNGQICILDFAYIYSVNYQTFNCLCDAEGLLVYDETYVNLCCPACGRKYDFREIRRRITRKQEQEEIGDIRRIGYRMEKESAILNIIKEFEPPTEEELKKRNKKVDPLKELNKQHLKQMKAEKKARKQQGAWG